MRSVFTFGALAFGLIVSSLLVHFRIEFDLLWTGLIAGSAAYGVHRLRGTGR